MDRTCSICSGQWLWYIISVSSDEDMSFTTLATTFFWRHPVKRINTFSSRLQNQTSAHQWPYVLLALQPTHVILLTPQWTANTSRILHMLLTLEAWAGKPVDWSKSHKYFEQHGFIYIIKIESVCMYCVCLFEHKAAFRAETTSLKPSLNLICLKFFSNIWKKNQ